MAEAYPADQDTDSQMTSDFDASQDLFDEEEENQDLKKAKDEETVRNFDTVTQHEFFQTVPNFQIVTPQASASTPSQGQDDDVTWRGVSIARLNTVLNINPPRPGDKHQTVFITWPKGQGQGSFSPHPSRTEHRWDEYHVRMPFSSECLFPLAVEGSKGKKELKSKWSLIQQALAFKIESSNDLENAIMTYNRKGRFNFNGLHEYFEEHVSEEEAEMFFNGILPGIARLVVDTPSVVTHPVPLLTRKRTHALTFSQRQIACLLANAFFCTYPRRNTAGTNSEYKDFPSINFDRLFAENPAPYYFEKVKCVLNYFRRVLSKNDEEGLVTFARKCVPFDRLPQWNKSDTTLRELHVDSGGMIENEGFGMLQVSEIRDHVQFPDLLKIKFELF